MHTPGVGHSLAFTTGGRQRQGHRVPVQPAQHSTADQEQISHARRQRTLTFGSSRAAGQRSRCSLRSQSRCSMTRYSRLWSHITSSSLQEGRARGAGRGRRRCW